MNIYIFRLVDVCGNKIYFILFFVSLATIAQFDRNKGKIKPIKRHEKTRKTSLICKYYQIFSS